jgi:hypothetical protein
MLISRCRVYFAAGIDISMKYTINQENLIFDDRRRDAG